ncbi:MAG TPA: outer membrane beta-barrel protein [Candidatus Sphingobacterium stercoripullorum]|uniref:Outer membrane beta-barrel protein n=1 Tax=Candidatus Sphingobacterium stercoripullorum TaxID=2838759 RepID=A0A9D2AZV5_9SPHI|nr:outer membrane beta-barrel protein [Candidatus Sphingobacterium stercoripullorum]HLR49775.1 outer membrane beta-barrel protein [Candidatus Sphingobacterium stercoripullorum]
MKKVLLTLSLAFGIFCVSQAQTQQGDVLLGGQVGFSTTNIKDSDNKAHSFQIAPQFGYFVSDNLVLGAGVGYAWEKDEQSKDDYSTSDLIGVAPFARNYYGYGDVKFYSQLTVPMAWGNNKVDGEKVNSIANYGVELAPGIAYFPTSRIGIDFKVRGLYFNSSTSKDAETGDKTTANAFGLDASSFNPTVGVSFHF